ncbi:hypothetical protein AB1K83_15105 [Sporosarcina sp. 179-K 3D1 HS]|uniref:hypothetical protein n=1 Tax=Sporosarcina sp. 179-K 3D1 HS TaxID=3232169 RepID=UPI0039A13846
MHRMMHMETTGLWPSLLSVIMFGLCIYFTLSFFQHLKSGDDRLINQSKLAAVIFLVLALLIPALFGVSFYNPMMRW